MTILPGPAMCGNAPAGRTRYWVQAHSPDCLVHSQHFGRLAEAVRWCETAADLLGCGFALWKVSIEGPRRVMRLSKVCDVLPRTPPPAA